MSLILCPECGTKISNKARMCPNCGFESNDSSRPISKQDKYESVPFFEYEIQKWNPKSKNLNTLSYEDNKNLVEYFGSWNNINLTLPSLAEAIKKMASKEKILIADMDSYIKSLIENGVYKFSIDKEGEILPTIKDSKRIIKQVRLKEMNLNPDASQALNHLSVNAAMVQILDEIKFLGEAISEIHIEMQNDRLAMAESSKDKLLQARRIQDSRLRSIAILNVISSATDAKRVLMKNFEQNLKYIKKHSQKSLLKLAVDFNKEEVIDRKSIDAFQALVSITNVIQIECEGYSMLGENESSKECLDQFKNFILENRLNERDTLLIINENLKYKQINVVDEFSDIVNRVNCFDEIGSIGNKNNILQRGEKNEDQ